MYGLAIDISVQFATIETPACVVLCIVSPEAGNQNKGSPPGVVSLGDL